MKSISIIDAALRADPEITKLQRSEVLRVLSSTPKPEPVTQSTSALLSQKATAEFLGVSRVTVHRMTKEAQLHPVKIRGALRYRRAEIEAIAGL